MERLGGDGPWGGTQKPAVDDQCLKKKKQAYLSTESRYVCSPYSSMILAIVTVRIEKNMKDPMK